MKVKAPSEIHNAIAGKEIAVYVFFHPVDIVFFLVRLKREKDNALSYLSIHWWNINRSASP
jgi:hypothetical protein